VKLLLDQNLSPHLVGPLERNFPGTRHARDVGLARADDGAIWQFAKEGGFVIVSKDADFHQLSFLHGHPPKVIWLRVGNRSTSEVLAVVQRSLDHIELFGANEDASFLSLS